MQLYTEIHSGIDIPDYFPRSYHTAPLYKMQVFLCPSFPVSFLFRELSKNSQPDATKHNIKC